MIIKTMEELGKAIDEGKELQRKEGESWISFDLDGYWYLRTLIQYLNTGLLRIKPEPKFVYVNIYRNPFEANVYWNLFHAEESGRHGQASIIAHKIELPEAGHE